MMNEIKKVKLSDGLDKTISWVWMEDGQLNVGYYDFSESAHEVFGNHIAYTLTVKEMNKLYSLAKQVESSIIQWLVENFKSYFGIEHWLKENEIEFSVERESWA